LESTGKKPNKFSGLVGQRGVSKIPLLKPKGKGKISRKSLASKKRRQLPERKQREPQIKSRKSLERPDKTERMVEKRKKVLEKASKAGGARKKGSKWFN
jgi:hypothetical protein